MDPKEIMYLAPGSFAALTLLEAVSEADAQGKALRLYRRGDTLCIKVGQGMWSEPYEIYNEESRPW